MKVLQFSELCSDKNNIHVADLILVRNESTTLHSHDFYELFVILKGNFRHSYNGKIEILKEGQFKIINPEDEHYFIGDGEKNILRNIAIRSEYYYSLKNNNLVDIEKKNSIYSLNDFVVNSFNYKSKMLIDAEEGKKRYIMKSLFSDLIINAFLDVSSDSKIPIWLKKAYEEMKQKENFLEGIKKFVDLSGKTQEHLTRELKKYYNLSPSEYINSLRLKEATNLLIQSELPIIDIILNCGFNNIGYFNRSFKKHYGVTPREYRKLNKKIF